MFTLIDLPYAQDGLEPVISARTLEFHHGKHLQGYVDNLNKLIAGTEFESMSLEEIVARSASLPAPTGNPIFNNAGQILNHNLYFTQFRPSALRKAQVPTEARHSEDSDSSCHFDRAQRAEKSALITQLCRRHPVHRPVPRRRQPRRPRPPSPPDLRRLGTRLLPRLPEPPRRAPRGPVGDCRLERGGRKVQSLTLIPCGP